MNTTTKTVTDTRTNGCPCTDCRCVECRCSGNAACRCPGEKRAAA